MVELHFCSQCGISVPQAEVDWAGAKTADGRYLCAEHRRPAAGAATPAPAAKDDVSLLFCANCRVSIPADDEKSGRAVREFGSLLCAACTKADPAERERRRRAVDAEMASDETAAPAFASDRPPEARMPPLPVGTVGGGSAPYARPGAGSGTWVLGTLAVLAFGAAGFFGAEYFQARRLAKSAEIAGASRSDDGLRADLARRIDELTRTLDERDDRLVREQTKAIEDLRARLSEEMLAIRSDLADTRSELTSVDKATTERLAKLEGQVLGIQEMMKGLAARGSDSRGGDPPPSRTPDPVPAGPTANDPPAPAPGAPTGPPAPDPAVTKLVKDLLESKDAGVRFNAALELIRLGNRAAIPPFAKACVSDEHVMVRRVSARGLGSLKAWNGVPVLIQALEDREVYVAQQADFALQQITQQEFGVGLDTTPRDRKSKAAAAMKWWEKNKDNPPEGVSLEPTGMPGR